MPDATFDDFDNLRNFLKILNKIMRIDNLIKLCEKIGNNVLFVQGAGGNISVKNKDTLMVKHLVNVAEASKKYFVSVNQSKLINQINKGFNLILKLSVILT